MTIISERPDYSSVPSMAWEPDGFDDKYDMYQYLISLKLKCIIDDLHYENVCWYQKENSFLGVHKDNSIVQNWVSRDEFKAPFAAIHREWEESKTNQLNKRDYSPHIVKPGLLVPTEEEIKEYLNDKLVYGQQRKEITEYLRWIIKTIIERNK